MAFERQWIVLIADLRGSRAIGARRRAAVDRAFERAARRTAVRFGDAFRLAPEVLRGDELQAVLRADAPALTVLTYLRGQLAIAIENAPELRGGIGSGAIERLSPKGPFASDGPAFHRARAALEAAKKAGGSRLTAWQTGAPAFDTLADVILALADALAARWTRPQWEAIVGRLEDKGLEGIARERGVSFQSVSKRLRAASWNEVAAACARIEAEARDAVQPLAVETAHSTRQGRT
jgi:hypothetical protein